MKKLQRALFFRRLSQKKRHFPFRGQLELTYRCNLNCIHCYCKGLNNEEQELTTGEWKEVLDTLQKEGCISLTLTGGDPLIREDFLQIYSYAKAKGFIITLFTNGLGFTTKVIDYLVKSPPNSVEITLNGINQDTYEAITQVKGSFPKVMQNLKALKEKKVPLRLKVNCLKQNKSQIGRIKAFSEELLGKLPKNTFYFSYDKMINNRINGDKAPSNFRLSFEEMLEIDRQDPDMWREHLKDLRGDFPKLKRKRNFLYLCDSWMEGFFINPYGRLKFCVLSDKFSINLKKIPFKEGFYNLFPRILGEEFKTNSKCKDCRLRPICRNCPAKAYLETGDEEAPAPYFCELAKRAEREWKNANAGV